MSQRSDEFERLVEKHARVMASAIRRVCGKHHGFLIPDVEQEVRLALWKRLQSGKEIEHPISYLYKVALTTALAVVQRLGGAFGAAEPGEPASAGPGADVSRGLLPVERALLIAQTLEKLPVEQSRALRGYLAGLNHKEVAALFGWSESVARHHIYGGMEALRARAGAEKRGA